RKRDVPFLWMVHPTATPGLAERLHERGLKEAETCPGMTRLLRDLPPPRQLPPDITLCEVDDETGASALLELVGWRWSVPEEALPRLREVTRAFAVGTPGSGARSWLAFRDGKPVAKILLNLAGGVAGVYGVATRPEARGVGLARALTLHAFAAARREG